MPSGLGFAIHAVHIGAIAVITQAQFGQQGRAEAMSKVRNRCHGVIFSRQTLADGIAQYTRLPDVVTRSRELAE